MITQPSETPSRDGYGRRQRVVRVLGPSLLGVVCLLPSPDGLTPQAKNLGALIALMAVWWMTEAVPLAATSLLPLGLLPALGMMKPEAVAAALLLFLIPTDLPRGQFVFEWAWAVRIPWEVLFLFGGGFTLATGFRVTGLGEWLAGGLQLLAVLPLGLLMLVLCLVVIFASEIASNTALASLLLPILAATAKGLDIHPYLLMLPATLAASCGFMLPLAMPPNAVAFASGYVTAPQMLRVGVVLDVLGAILVTLTVYTLGRAVFGLD